jgi:5'-nucleotidase
MAQVVRRFVWIGFIFFLIVSCASRPQTEQGTGAADVSVESRPLTLSIFHVNDTHAKLESALVEFRMDVTPDLKGKRTFIELGGFPNLWSAVEKLRAQKPNSIFLHAGDVFQGTLYFTEFKGLADGDFLNAMKLDALVAGNHEFDKGPQVLADFIQAVNFPVLGCNLDVTAESTLTGKIKPYVIREFGGSRVAIVGLANSSTPDISSPGPAIKFLDSQASLEKVVQELEQKNINKIIVLSHEGFERDKELAQKVAGVDVIVGGHSHFILGDVKDLGLTGAGPYPVALSTPRNEPALVVTSWQWAYVIGDVEVDFDGRGVITSYRGTPRFVAGSERFRIYDLPDQDGKQKRVQFQKNPEGRYAALEYDGKSYSQEPTASAGKSYDETITILLEKIKGDPRFLFVENKKEGVEKLSRYSPAIKALQAKLATTTMEALKRGNNKGPGPIIADSMRWKTKADVAIMNPGGVRIDLPAGDISVAQIYELQPFSNTLVTLAVTGQELVNILEDMADFCITSYSKNPETAYLYLSGVRLQLFVNNPKGSRISNVEVFGDGSYKSLDPAGSYSLVVNNFMADGGDKNETLKSISKARKYDTGFVDSEVLLDYVLGKTLIERTEERVKNVM